MYIYIPSSSFCFCLDRALKHELLYFISTVFRTFQFLFSNSLNTSKHKRKHGRTGREATYCSFYVVSQRDFSYYVSSFNGGEPCRSAVTRTRISLCFSYFFSPIFLYIFFYILFCFCIFLKCHCLTILFKHHQSL